MFQLYFVSLTLKGYEQFSVNRSYVFHLAGHLRTAILADHHLGILSKDHTRNTVGIGVIMIPYLKVYMTQKIFPAYLKGLSKYRRMAFFFLKCLFSF